MRIGVAIGILAILAGARLAKADQLLVAIATCIPEMQTAQACGSPDAGPLARWRVVNFLADNGVDSSDILDVSFTFATTNGATTWTWNSIASGTYMETEVFDVSALGNLTSLTLNATLPRMVFDPVYAGYPYLSFVADTAQLSASATVFPPPLDLFASGTFVLTTPEPFSFALVGTGLLVLAIRRLRS